ncbi:hypothetical protein [Microbacterium plantarum]|uniref:hypothetical protein n=1 Tax=Microbacterium plantarum TaxID=1816425 RepID=UPI002B49D0D6|nr:hypothetical protein [Microbacterium plantarum]WRK16537.1 hypothetical protein VC184_11525 [Microbacterium plantarum]
MSVAITLPEVPVVGLQFRPDKTDSIGTVTAKRGASVEYTFAHAPEVVHTRPWHEVRRISWAV